MICFFISLSHKMVSYLDMDMLSRSCISGGTAIFVARCPDKQGTTVEAMVSSVPEEQGTRYIRYCL